MNAQELAQDTLTRVFFWLQREGNKIEGDNGFMKTCFGFARNIMHEVHNQRSRAAQELPAGLSTSGNKTLGLFGVEASVFLGEVLRQLPARDRELILNAESVPQEKLAEQMGIPLATLRVWLHRARNKLKKLLRRPPGLAGGS